MSRNGKDELLFTRQGKNLKCYHLKWNRTCQSYSITRVQHLSDKLCLAGEVYGVSPAIVKLENI